MRAIKELTSEYYKRLISKFMSLSKSDLLAIRDDEESPSIHVIVASCLLRATAEGDVSKIDPLLNRSLGKVKEAEQEVNLNFKGLPKTQIIEIGMEAIRFLQKAAKDE